MIVLFLLQVAQSIKLTEFGNFAVNLKANVTEHFLFQGEVDYAYFHRKNKNFELWLVQNDSYEVYHAPYSSNLTFDWPSYKGNGEHMSLVEYEGAVHPPLQFESEIFMTAIFSLCVNNISETMVDTVYKYNSFEEWLIYVAVLIVLVALGLCNHESIAAILRAQIPWLVRWGGAFLSRGQEEISSNEEGN